MSLAEQSQKWLPTHVQVTVLESRNLPAKGKGATNDAYTIIQLGKEKYSTSVAEKSLSPVWKEEASFELPGLLVPGTPERYELHLIVMHRSLVGLDKFLGQVAISLNDIFENKQRKKTEWFKLESKPGKKPKDRGEIKASIQFVRNNMTASMFDLSMKDKSRSPFSKLKDKVKFRKHDGTFSDTSSAIFPSRSGSTPDASLVGPLDPVIEPQSKTKPRKPFLLGPQRLSAAHSMSDLMVPPGSRPGGVGQSLPIPRQLDSISGEDSAGSLKSPHRRTLSADTSKISVSEGSSEEPGSATSSHNDPFANGSSALPQKFATLPRQRNPFEDGAEAWDGDVGAANWFSRPGEAKKELKKKEKVSLFDRVTDRVTGKKEGKRSEHKLSNGGSEGFNDSKSSGVSGDTRSSSAEFDSTNPFATNFKITGAMSSMFGFHSKPSSTEDLGTAMSSERLRTLQRPLQGQKDKDRLDSEAASAYRSLTHEEVVKELLKHKELLKKKDSHIRELEDYIDDLLVRVMEETPGILRVPYERARRAGKFSKN
ncbi:rab11 family-interacting protein 2 isoform X1 [Pleurodeles waltl]|uniref:rab11 family-interacting protein 2 isoform X1 n=1 Tax=Pleurodeles waltl TaxID=8319 RepID=UPI0037093987